MRRIRFLSAKTDEERAHYDWMGYIAMALGVAFLIPLPFAGYWLMREVYAYRQQMGITLMGGLLAWLFIIQATMIGILVPEHQLLSLAGDGPDARRGEVSTVHQISCVPAHLRISGFYHSAHDRHDAGGIEGHGRTAAPGAG